MRLSGPKTTLNLVPPAMVPVHSNLSGVMLERLAGGTSCLRDARRKVSLRARGRSPIDQSKRSGV